MKTATVVPTLAALAVLALAPPSGAQGQFFQPSSPYPPRAGTVPAGPQQYGPGFPSPGQYPTQLPPTTPPAVLPPGVEQLYALEGTNTILAMATPEGYERVRELVRNLDGQLDIVQTKVVSVEAPASDLAALGVTLQAGASTVSGTGTATLLAALRVGRLQAADILRITTRENTPVDALIHAPGARHATSGQPFSLVPRVTRDGSVALEINQPLAVTVSVRAGETTAVVLPGGGGDKTHLLFLTPSVLASSARPGR